MHISFSPAEKFREENGITLIDVMISIAILAVGIMAVAKLQLVTSKCTTNGNVLTMATMLAQSHLEQIKNINDISELDDVSHPLVVTQHFDTEGNAVADGLYRITTDVADVVLPGGGTLPLARDVEVTVQWGRVWGANKRVILRTVTQGNGV
jgi:Tfp pilus assembly protein PilV